MLRTFTTDLTPLTTLSTLFLLTLGSLLIPSISFAADEKHGRFFEDQPDINDDYQIHFNYMVSKDGQDREWDLNGKMEEILLNMNEIMFKATSENRKSNGVGKRYKFDFRHDGKLDITFIRLEKNHKELHKWANNDIAPYLYRNNFYNRKKIYFNFADMKNVDGGAAGVGMGSAFLRNSGNLKNNYQNYSKDKRLIYITLHELLHTQGGGYRCIKGMANNHYADRDGRHQLQGGLKLNKNLYIHDYEGCPQLIDSVYLTPTSNDPYDPYRINCLFDIGRYTHKKILGPIQKLRKNGKFDWKQRFGASCKWRDYSRDDKGYFLMGSNVNILSN